jgi:PBSX family phage portal protein
MYLAAGGTGGLSIVQPQYNLQRLADMVQISNILRQCIESYTVNIDSYGGVLEYVGPEGGMKKPAAQAEKAELEAFIAGCSAEFSFTELRTMHRWDKETLGFGTFEVTRAQNGKVAMFDHLPSITIRRTTKDKTPVEIEVLVPETGDNGIVKYRKTAMKRHFCRYVQSAADGRKTYFKEFGDPRPVNPKTGAVDASLSIEDQATEVLCLGHYVPGSTYGLPRWLGQVPSILGSRESEMVNLNFFRENAIPAMAILISGGALTAESFETIENYITALKGQKAMHRMIVLEATADDMTGSTDHAQSAPKIDMKPMISERQQDGLFQDYDQKSQQKVRSSFRLPPIYAGRAEDYTRASAQASMQTAENQIFGPERMAFDDMFNSKILRTFQPRYWRYKSYGPPLNEPETLSRMLAAFETTGALTPNVVIKIANRMLDVQIEPIKEEWGDMPFGLTLDALQSGAKVKGLENYITQVETAAAAPPAAAGAKPTNDNKPAATAGKKPLARKLIAPPATGPGSASFIAMQRMVRRELKMHTRDIRNAISEGALDEAV